MTAARRRGERGDAAGLGEILARVAAGEYPPADGAVEVLPPPSARDWGVIAFTAHHVVFADVDPAWVRDRLPEGDLSAPLNPPFLTALCAASGRRVNNVDLLTLAPALPGPAPLALRPATGADHPRVRRAGHYRDDVRVWTCPEGVVILGRGVAGRWEVAVEVAEGHRGRGVGRALAAAARHLLPAGTPLWAQVAPGNAASVRAFLAAGYTPVGAEALLVAH
ncbi:GNAT family N-acetyltransferase [Bailinhaonella thermotolerans]|uniref:GNAT family N-acetyltransferase n=1 Tax=Bailinhaonella thermotolerans TaxID=1070861 RepID=A0A3A4BAX9_9ACTN|nr:GNAT family N-acetyltransferase [Bailinhaonella thermotolerans]